MISELVESTLNGIVITREKYRLVLVMKNPFNLDYMNQLKWKHPFILKAHNVQYVVKRRAIALTYVNLLYYF